MLGYGEPLVAIEGPSVADPVAKTFPLIGSIVRHGQVLGLQDGILHVQSPADWSDAFRVVVWPRVGPLQQVHVTAPEAGAAGPTLPIDDTPLAVALLFGDTPVGAWWSDGWSEDLGETPEDVRRGFLAARWMKLPISASPHRERLQRAAQGQLAAAYGAWVRPDQEIPLDGLTLRLDLTRDWAMVARGVLYDCVFDSDRYGKVNKALDGAEVIQLGREYKALVGTGAQARLRRFLVLEVGPQPVLGYHEHASSNPGGFAKASWWYFVGDASSSNAKRTGEARKLVGSLLRDVKTEVSLWDEKKLAQLCQDSTEWGKVRYALGSAAFRAYASLHLLKSLLGPESSAFKVSPRCLG